MAYDALVVKVMIASPGDVSTERQVVRDVLTEWNYIHSEDKRLVLMPIGWETHSSPAMGDRPQAIINKQVLADCDLLVAVFWTRIGSPTGNAVSGTVEEIEEHLRAGKPAMLYFSSAPVRLDSIDEEQYHALKEFKQECYNRGLVETYESIGEFRDKLSRQLSQTIIRHFPTSGDSDSQSGDLFPTQTDLPALGEVARTLLMEAAADSDGTVLRMDDSEGLTVLTNNKRFPEEQNPRTVARWERAFEELENLGLLVDRGYKREVFNVTDEGYRVSDLLRADGSASTTSST